MNLFISGYLVLPWYCSIRFVLVLLPKLLVLVKHVLWGCVKTFSKESARKVGRGVPMVGSKKMVQNSVFLSEEKKAFAMIVYFRPRTIFEPETG